MDILKLARISSIQKFSSDEIFFNEGDPGHEMFVILAGKVNVFINSVDGYPISIAKLKAGDFFGEMSLLEGMPRSASVQALEETQVLVINKDNFQEVICQEPSLAFRIMKGLSNRVRKQNEEIRQNKPKTEETVKVKTPISPNLHNSWLFPHGHKTYAIVAPDNHEYFLFDRKVDCPVCSKVFDVKMVHSTRLALQKIEPDFRQRYENFEPLWYMIWVCPHCFYANFNFEFQKVSEKAKDYILKESAGMREKVWFQFTKPRDLDQVFTAYYLALHCLKTSTADMLKMGKLWLHLSWLYQDADDAEMFKMTSAQALECYRATKYNYMRNISTEQEQRLCLLIGELYLRNGKNEEALKHFHYSIVHHGGSRYINKQAQDRILDLKS